jgi:hypothetical protein
MGSALRVLLLGAVVGAVATGCGGGAAKSPQELVQAAAAKTRGYASVRFRASVEFEITGGARSIRVNGTGASIDHGRIVVMDATFDEPSAGITHLPVKLVLGDNVSYLRYESPGLASLMPPGKPWVVVTNGAQAPELGQNDPAQLVSYLESTSDMRFVRTEAVDGLSTSHYSGSLVLDKVRQRAIAAGASTALFDAVAAIGLKKIPIDAWIDERGLLRRIRAELHIANPQNSSQKLRLLESADFFDYGATVRAQVPSRSQAITLKQFEKRVSGK